MNHTPPLSIKDEIKVSKTPTFSHLTIRRKIMVKKEVILKMKNGGASYTEIARELGIPIGTVKSIVKRAKAPKKVEESYCLECGASIKSLPKHKKKKFCSDLCRMNYWKKNNNKFVEGRCKCCDKRIHYYPSRHRSFCSRACYLKFMESEEHGN